MTKRYLKMLVAGAAFFFVFGILATGEYPLLYVNGHFLIARDLWQEVRAFKTSYASIAQAYGSGVAMPSDTQIKTAILTEMVNQILVRDELARTLDAATLNYVLNEKLNPIRADASVRAGAEKLYGLPFTAIEPMVFRPQAEAEILSSQLFSKKITLDDWLRDAKRQVHVITLFFGVYWNGETVVSK